MSKSYFYKELASSDILLAGKPLSKQTGYELLGGNRAVLAVDSDTQADLLTGLELFASEHRGGIVKISEEEYTQKKTQFPPLPNSAASSRKSVLRAMPNPKDLFPKVTAPAAAPADPNAPPNPYNPYGVGQPPAAEPGTPRPTAITQITAPPPGTFQTPEPAQVESAASPAPEPAAPFKPKTGRVASALKVAEATA